ncbi:MAG TPA: pilin [Patescibacteria group bacterium]|nr:pilin [Patescibacteria group bacterium]
MTHSFALTRPKLFLAGIFFILSFFLAMASQVSATSQAICPPGQVPDGSGGCKELDTPQYQTPTSGTETIARIINIVLGFLGLIALVLFIIGGFQWMTSGGNEDKTSAAKKLMISAVIGLVIILAAAVISNFAFNAIQKSLGEEGGSGEL